MCKCRCNVILISFLIYSFFQMNDIIFFKPILIRSNLIGCARIKFTVFQLFSCLPIYFRPKRPIFTPKSNQLQKRITEYIPSSQPYLYTQCLQHPHGTPGIYLDSCKVQRQRSNLSSIKCSPIGNFTKISRISSIHPIRRANLQRDNNRGGQRETPPTFSLSLSLSLSLPENSTGERRRARARQATSMSPRVKASTPVQCVRACIYRSICALDGNEASERSAARSSIKGKSRCTCVCTRRTIKINALRVVQYGEREIGMEGGVGKREGFLDRVGFCRER